MRRFKVGDTVRYFPGRGLSTAPYYTVIALYPREDSDAEFAYRIKSPGEPTERLAREGQLEPFREQSKKSPPEMAGSPDR
jgi:hypothetical protein